VGSNEQIVWTNGLSGAFELATYLGGYWASTSMS
jgi:hypothetical protein